MACKSRVCNPLKARIGKLMSQGGPDVQDYQHVDNLMTELSTQIRNELITSDELMAIRAEFGASLSNTTVQGFMLNKPHGYAGNYEIIERMYNWHISPDEQGDRWDIFLQNHAASRAVRNQKTYFKQALKSFMQRHNRTEIRLLNLASGPCAELVEFLQENPDYRLIIDYIDADKNAIYYAKEKLVDYTGSIQFIHKNLFHFMPDTQYDIIWLVGLFDYVNDKQLLQLISRFVNNLAPEGELIVGNFTDNCPSRCYTDLIDWPLNYRNEKQLLQLGSEAVPAGNPFTVRIGREPENVNLFLHIKRLGNPNQREITSSDKPQWSTRRSQSCRQLPVYPAVGA